MGSEKAPSLRPPEREPAPGFRRHRFIIAYDGTAYAGWQTQKNGVGVQAKIEEALKALFQTRLPLYGSSRTDAGVHALGMVAHVDLPIDRLRMPAQKIALALNGCLPPDIRICTSRVATPRFHARFDAKGKEYRYQFWNQPAHNPLLLNRAWHVPRPLDLVAMRTAAAQLLGRHDFKSFANTREYEMESTVRTITACRLVKQGPLLTLHIRGDGFLYKMCRGIAGTLVQVGQGKFAAEELIAILESRDRRVAGMTAPAQGLTLWKVFY